MLLATALGAAWTLEQPDGSVLEFYPAWRTVMQSIFAISGPRAVSVQHLARCWLPKTLFSSVSINIICSVLIEVLVSYFPNLHWWTNNSEVCKVKWWMQHYSAKTPTRHYGYANTRAIMGLDRGKLTKDQRKPKHERIKTADAYYDKHGVRRYKGNANLRPTEKLESDYIFWFSIGLFCSLFTRK